PRLNHKLRERFEATRVAGEARVDSSGPPRDPGGASMSQPHRVTTNALLGYPEDARLLLVNADDFGMYPAINEAVVRAFEAGLVRSTSLMAPCPGAPEAMRLLREHPGLPVGVHLSIVRDIASYRWGPLAPQEHVP